MLFSIVLIALNAVYYSILKMDLYTDRALMPDGSVREWHRSPVTRLNISGKPVLLYLIMFFAAVSVVTNILVMLGVKNSTVRIIRIVSTIASTVMFIIIMIATGNANVSYV